MQVNVYFEDDDDDGVDVYVYVHEYADVDVYVYVYVDVVGDCVFSMMMLRMVLMSRFDRVDVDVDDCADDGVLVDVDVDMCLFCDVDVGVDEFAIGCLRLCRGRGSCWCLC